MRSQTRLRPLTAVYVPSEGSSTPFVQTSGPQGSAAPRDRHRAVARHRRARRARPGSCVPDNDRMRGRYGHHERSLEEHLISLRTGNAAHTPDRSITMSNNETLRTEPFRVNNTLAFVDDIEFLNEDNIHVTLWIDYENEDGKPFCLTSSHSSAQQSRATIEDVLRHHGVDPDQVIKSAGVVAA